MSYGPGRAELTLALHSLAAESASGVSAAIDLADGSAFTGGCGPRSLAYLDLDVTAASGMGSVTSSGTTPPTVTVSGTPAQAVSLVVQCTLAGALGVWAGRLSPDGGQTWTAFTSSASVALGAMGLTMAIAAGNAATDNAWASSTPTLALALETSRDGALWHKTVPLAVDDAGRLPSNAIGSFDAVAVAGWQRRAFLDLDRYVRVVWTIIGSGASFTFALSGSALLVYARLRDAASLAMRAGALGNLSVEEVADQLVAASDQADQKLGARFDLPLAAWGMGVAKHTGSIFALNAMGARGYAPEPGARDTWKDGYDRAMDFFDEVFTRGDPSIKDQTPSPADDFQVGGINPPQREWTSRGWAR